MASPQKTLNSFSIDHLQRDLKGRSVRGGLLTLTSQGVQFALNSVSTIVLAHLLTPTDFGLVAMVTAITGLAQGFAGLGLSEATIQHPEIHHEQVSKLFWVNVGIGVGLTIVTASLAPFLAWFYHEPRLRAITYVTSFIFLIGGLRVQHDALLQRNMQFYFIAIRDVAAYLVAVPTAILLARRGWGYWAIVALPLTANFIQMTLSWVMARWIPGLPRRNVRIRHFITYGGGVAASYLTFNFTRSVDNILIGWYWGAGPLGLYSRAMNLLLLPVRQLGAPARSVAVPAFSRLQDDPDRLARFYLRTANLIMWITAPVFGFLFVAATPVIVLTLGRQWQAAGPVFQNLAIFALGQLLYESVIWLFVSRGQSKRLLKLVLILCPITVCSYAIGLPFGIKGVALSGALGMLLAFPWMMSFSFRGTRLTLARLGGALVYPVISCLSGVAIGELALHFVDQMSAISQILIIGVAFAVGSSFTLILEPVRREVKQLRDLLRIARGSSSEALAESLV
ncbi:MAG: lipopolysaccharide biosynthesis protein [Terracidiphilus sp.]